MGNCYFCHLSVGYGELAWITIRKMDAQNAGYTISEVAHVECLERAAARLPVGMAR